MECYQRLWSYFMNEWGGKEDQIWKICWHHNIQRKIICHYLNILTPLIYFTPTTTRRWGKQTLFLFFNVNLKGSLLATYTGIFLAMPLTLVYTLTNCRNAMYVRCSRSCLQFIISLLEWGNARKKWKVMKKSTEVHTFYFVADCVI